MKRRDFLQHSAAAVVGTAAALTTAGARAAEIAWDETVDVVVVGSGFAGLMAAYMAKKAGANVVVLEKMPTAGGNSIVNGGIMGVPNTEMQAKLGIEDSPERMAADMMKAGLNMNHPEKVKALCESANAAYRTLVDELGVRFRDDYMPHEGGHSVARSLLTINGSGSEIVNKELAALEKLGVKPRLRTIMDEIVLDDKGAAAGVRVREGYRFGRADSGKAKTIRALKGIVLAYGGFSADPEYRQMFDPKLTPDIQSTNHVGATAEGWRAAARIGAQMIQNDWIQTLPYTSPDEKGFGLAWAWSGHVQALGFWIDAATGERFVNELADRKIRADAIFVCLQKGHECLAIGDRKAAESFEIKRPGMLARQLAAKCVFEYPTIEALAQAHKVPLDKLKETIAIVNKSIETGEDPWGRMIEKLLKPQTEGPWYVCRLSPKVHHTMGGLLTTEKAEVINVDGRVIPGLYAAGEATGGVHGAVRLGSNATTDCIVNGRIAGMEVAKR